jgi:hypothetical protein
MTIRQSYAVLIQQTINLTVSGSQQQVTIWDYVPNTPNDYGEPGWTHMTVIIIIFTLVGRWLRQSIADWIV